MISVFFILKIIINYKYIYVYISKKCFITNVIYATLGLGRIILLKGDE